MGHRFARLSLFYWPETWKACSFRNYSFLCHLSSRILLTCLPLRFSNIWVPQVDYCDADYTTSGRKKTQGDFWCPNSIVCCCTAHVTIIWPIIASYALHYVDCAIVGASMRETNADMLGLDFQHASTCASVCKSMKSSDLNYRSRCLGSVWMDIAS